MLPIPPPWWCAMKSNLLLIPLTLVVLSSSSPAHGDASGEWSPAQREILDAIARLSASTAPGGDGPDAYGAVLTDDFTRWTIGSQEMSTRDEWVDGVREWFVDGWRVADRESEILEITIEGPFAFSSRIVTETYVGPDGDRPPPASAALAEVWKRDDAGWRLHRVAVHPLQD